MLSAFSPSLFNRGGLARLLGFRVLTLDFGVGKSQDGVSILTVSSGCQYIGLPIATNLSYASDSSFR